MSLNNKAYSIEYLKLFQAVCSEIDVLGKELAEVVFPGFVVDKNTNIKQWGYAIQQIYPDLKNELILFHGSMIQQPFKDWEYEENITIDKDGNSRRNLRKKKDKAMQWWSDYNTVKHRRVGLVKGTKNYKLSNQKNLVLAFSALYILESKFIELLFSEMERGQVLAQSKLFSKKVS